jgi:hypothetical protein
MDMVDWLAGPVAAAIHVQTAQKLDVTESTSPIVARKKHWWSRSN